MTASTQTPLWARSATALAAAIRAGEVTSEEVVDACLRRVAEVNPAVNAATVVFEDRARRAAQQADAALRDGSRGDLGPLHGVPFSVKENIDLTWSASSNGLPLLKGAVPEADATDVARLRAAGAIPLIRTNMPDLGMRWHTDNALFGATVNPWDASRTPGGSSGGEGAAIATGMTPFGVGNDYGGSVRHPAHANGVCGLKPTPGRIPVWKPGPGIFPFTAQAFTVEGPLARTVDDLDLAYSLMCGPDGIDTLTVPALDDPFPDLPRRVAAVTDPGGSGTAPWVTAAVRLAADALRQAGWEVTETEPPFIAEAAQLWRALALSDQMEFLYSSRAGLAQHCSADIRRYTEDFAAHTRRLDVAGYGAAVGRRVEIRSAWSAFQQQFPLILAPVVTQAPFRVGRDLEGPDATDEIFQANRMLVAVSCLGNPAVALPVGTVTDGMPDGVQLIGPWFGERLALAAARDVERACGIATPIDPR
jgi:amidase